MATIRNAILMQDRMTPVFNKMFTAMQRTLDVMEGLNGASKDVMSDTSGVKQAQQAINSARNDIVKLQKDLDVLSNKKINVAVNVQKNKAQELSGFTNKGASIGVPEAQLAGTPPISVAQLTPPKNIYVPLTKEAEEANAASLKVQSSINGIRAPNDLVTTFTQSGSVGRNAGRIISAAMTQASDNAAKVNVESLKFTKALAGVDYQATALGGNSFGQQMKAQLDRVNKEAEELNQNLQETQQQANNAGSSMKLLNLSAGIALARQAWDAVSGSAAYLDNLSSIQARLNNINDGTQTTTQLQSKIMAAANRSRASYQDMADSVAKLNLLASDAFSSNDQAIAFSEQLNKMFVISGTSAQEASAAMYQLNQAMASGRLQGDEFRSIIENAPMLANAIAKSLGVSRAKLKEMSSEGAITASVIKKAMADCADEVNEQFEKMPMTFSQSMNLLQNEAAAKMQAVADTFSNVLNSGDIQIIADAFGGVITVAAYTAMAAIKALSVVLGFLGNNMNWIGPIVAGLTVAFGAYTAVLIANKIASLAGKAAAIAQAIAEYAKAGAMGTSVSATAAATAAQYGLNTALWACPVTWVVAGFIALIAILYAVIGAINQFCGTSISVIGVIAGAVFALGAVIYNVGAMVYNFIVFVLVSIYNIGLSVIANLGTLVNWLGVFVANLAILVLNTIITALVGLYSLVLIIVAGLATAWDYVWKFIANLAISAAEWVVNTWNTGVNNIQKFLANIGKIGATVFKSVAEAAGSAASALANAFIKGANKAIDGINWIIDAINLIPGVDISKADKIGEVNWKPDTSGFDSYISDMDKILNSTPEKVSFDKFEYDGFQMPDLPNLDDYTLDYLTPEEWTTPEGLLDPGDYYADFKNISDAYNNGYKWGENLENSIGDFFNGSDLGIPDDVANDVSNIADMLGKGNNGDNNVGKVGKVGSVGKVEDDIELSDEDIKMLKDIASTKYINKFTTLQPNMTVQFGDVHETADIDELMDAIETMTEQALSETILEER